MIRAAVAKIPSQAAGRSTALDPDARRRPCRIPPRSCDAGVLPAQRGQTGAVPGSSLPSQQHLLHHRNHSMFECMFDIASKHPPTDTVKRALIASSSSYVKPLLVDGAAASTRLTPCARRFSDAGTSRSVRHRRARFRRPRTPEQQPTRRPNHQPFSRSSATSETIRMCAAIARAASAGSCRRTASAIWR